jgi:hypothetical protein
MSRCHHARRLIATIAIVAGAWASIAAPAGATGGSTIATAPELPLGGLGTFVVAIDGPNNYQLRGYPPLQSPIGGCNVVTPFSLTATVEHLTQVSFGSLPSHLSSPRKRLRLRASVQSPAGTPVGTCLFERMEGSLPVRVADAPVRDGVCAAGVRAGRTGSFPYRVTFSGPGWQTAQAVSRRVVVG